jgi:hypothetical protein
MLFHAVVQGEDGGREEEALRSWLEPLTGIVNDLVSPSLEALKAPPIFILARTDTPPGTWVDREVMRREKQQSTRLPLVFLMLIPAF